MSAELLKAAEAGETAQVIAMLAAGADLPVLGSGPGR